MMEVTNEKYWQKQEILGGFGKDNGVTRVVKNCHVVIAIDHTDAFESGDGMFIAGNSFWYTQKSGGSRIQPQTMSAVGTLSCHADAEGEKFNYFLNYIRQPSVPKNYKPGMRHNSIWQERHGVIKGFPRINTYISPGPIILEPKSGQGFNAGFGFGRAGFDKLFNAAWEAGRAQQEAMAKDCKGECDNITLVFISASPKASKKLINDGYSDWNGKSKTIPCKEGKKCGK